MSAARVKKGPSGAWVLLALVVGLGTGAATVRVADGFRANARLNEVVQAGTFIHHGKAYRIAPSNWPIVVYPPKEESK